MGEAILILAGLLVLGGLASLWRAWRHWTHGRHWRAGGHGGVGVTLSALAVLAGLAAVDLAGYQRLAMEAPVATLRFQSAGPDAFAVDLITSAGGDRSYRLRGQDWRLDARVLKWRTWAALLGFEPLYQLRRLSGRYATVTDARSQTHTVYALGRDRGVDVWLWARRLRLPFVDAVYGSSVYLPMANGAEYRVSIGIDGLIARPANAAARQAVDGWH